MKKWSLLVAICVLSSLATPLMSRTQQYETYLEALEGSVLCRQGLIGYGGELLEYWGWLTDPNGSLVAQDYKQTWSWRLDGQYTHEPSISGTYMCHADFYASGAQVASRQAPVQIYTKPTGETTASGGWSNETIHLFNQTLTGSGSFVDRWVTEEDPGGGGPDYCYYPGSPVPEFIAISTPGYLWRVGSGNTWGPDAVGWPSGSVQHYRSAGRAPCYTTFPQRMEISMQPSGGSYVYAEYANNTLGAGITTTHVYVARGDVLLERQWP